jgi:hypothetical protein
MSTNEPDDGVVLSAAVVMVGGSVRFNPGRVLATPGALAALQEQGRAPHALLLRHLRGDWGDVSPGDARLNDQALIHGDRLLSSYGIGGDERIWIITEADRSATTVLLPSEY